MTADFLSRTRPRFRKTETHDSVVEAAQFKVISAPELVLDARKTALAHVFDVFQHDANSPSDVTEALRTADRLTRFLLTGETSSDA